jgi:hypothetical protein
MRLLLAQRERHAAAPPSSVMNTQRFNLIELHSKPASQTRIVRYRIGEAESGGMGAISQPANPV